jgi:phenylpyruvate tautomerase PptA (4-oxalocrotonate tautomerase family)
MPMIDVYAAEGTFSDKHAHSQLLTDIVAAAAGDPSLTERTWVLITESPEGGWGMNGHANTGADIVAAARHALAQK